MLKTLLGATALTLVASMSLAQAPSPTSPSSPGSPPGAAAPARPAPTVKAEPMKVDALIGKDLKNPAQETIGAIDNVVVDPDGKIQQVIVSVGGFLGVGSKHVAIAWNQLRMDPFTDVAMVDMTKDQLKSAPEVTERKKAAAPAPATTSPGRSETTPMKKSE